MKKLKIIAGLSITVSVFCLGGIFNAAYIAPKEAYPTTQCSVVHINSSAWTKMKYKGKVYFRNTHHRWFHNNGERVFNGPFGIQDSLDDELQKWKFSQAK